jgi:hypothetical protein
MEAFGIITGLTGGSSYTLDAAMGVETGVAATAVKVGGPNDSVASTAWGGFTYELWAA